MYFETIRVKDMYKYMYQGKSILIDLRDKLVFEKEHIPEAINIPYEDIDEYADELKKYDFIILYCNRGNISMLAARDLGKLGCKQLLSIYGGYRAYKMMSGKK